MDRNINPQMSLADIVILLTLAILWGGSYFFIEIALRHLPPLTLVTGRVGLAAIALWGIALTLRLPLPNTWVQWKTLIVIGLLNNVIPFLLITWGQTQISSGLASIINATTPFFTVLIAGAVLADERLTRGKLIGVLIGLAGTVVLIGPTALSGVTGSSLGQLAVLCAALSYAFATVYSRRFKTSGLSPLIVATGQVTMAFLLILPFTLMIEKPWVDFHLPFEGLAALSCLAIFSTVIAYILFFRLIASAGATNAALVTFLIPISAIFLGVTLLSESFTSFQAFGMSLVGLGLLVMDGRLFSKLKPQAKV